MDATPSQPFPAQSTFGLIGATLDLFMRNITTFASTCIAPTLAISIVNILIGERPLAIGLVLGAVILFAELLIWSATTLVSIGAVLGHVPNVATAYRCAARSPLLTLFLAMAVVFMLVIGGTILLIVPGLIALAVTLLVPAIIVVERRSVWDSLRRSRVLGSGFYIRNVFIVITLFLPVIVGISFMSSPEVRNPGVEVAFALLTTVLQALGMLATVMIYIDMRARKEQLDPTTLALEINAAYGDRA